MYNPIPFMKAGTLFSLEGADETQLKFTYGRAARGFCYFYLWRPSL